MTLEGTVVNGQIVVTGDFPLPEGATVWIEFPNGEKVQFPGPPCQTYAAYLEELRTDIAEARAGIDLMDLEGFRAEMRAKYGSGPQKGEP